MPPDACQSVSDPTGQRAKRNCLQQLYLQNAHAMRYYYAPSSVLPPRLPAPLPNTRHHSELLRLVLSAQLLPVPALLLLSPDRHLTDSDRNEQRRAPVPVHKQDRNPRHALKSVVGASHPVEAKASGNAAISATRAAEGTQRQVCGEVGELAEDVQRHGGVGQEGRGVGLCGRGVGRVGEVCDQDAGEQPVVGGVLEDVEERHGSQGEAVDEEGLELALEEVQHDHPEGQGLKGRRAIVEGGQGVDVRTEVVEEWVNEERAEVLDDKDSTPGDLRTCKICQSAICRKEGWVLLS